MKTHTKSKLLFLLLICIGTCFSPPVYAVYFRNLGIKDGLAQLSVLSIHQDALGRIWFGTLEGLSIYNGQEMITLRGGNQQYDQYIKNNVIGDIVENAHHDIFFRADDALIKYKLRQGQFQCIRSDKVSSVSSIRGKIYASVQDTILVWDEGQNRLQFFMKTGILGANVNCIFQDRSNHWWVSTSRGIYKKVGGQWLCVVPGVFARQIYQSRSGDLWVATRRNGMYKIDTSGAITVFITDPANANTICHNDVRAITEDKQGNIWIGTHKGLNKYSVKQNKFEVYVADNLPGSLLHSSVFALLSDKNGDIWVGTYYGGVSSFTPGSDLYRYYPANAQRKDCPSFSFIGNMVEDKRHNLWICTDGGGLNFMDRKTNLFQYFNTKQSNIKADNLKCICYDAENDKLYIGLYLGGLTCFDIQAKRFKNYLDKAGKDYAHTTVMQIRMYKDKVIFLSERGIYMLNPKDDTIIPLPNINNCISFFIDSKDRMWVLCLNSVVLVDLHQMENQKEIELKSFGIGNHAPLCAYESKEGYVYIGTEGSGVLEYDPKGNRFSLYKAGKNGLLNDYFYNITGSKHGMIVFLGIKGLSFFNPKTKKVEYVAMGDKLPVSAFNDGNGLLAAGNGDLFVGSTDGLLVLSEDRIRATDKQTSLFFSNLFVNNVRILPQDETKILSQNISCTDQITLDHDQNNLVLTFANNDFGNSVVPAHYEYKLEGFNNEWSETEVQPLTYTNLNPGKYILKVRERNAYGNNTKPIKEVQLVIVVRAPFYDTPLAWIIYLLLLISILYVIISGRQRQMKLKTSLEYERIEKEHIEEINRFKLDFFTNISHELRTPLTLIITQADMLLNHKEVTKSVHEKVCKLYKHTFQMRNLISELLDFHKLDQNQMRLKVQMQNIVPLLNDIYSSFQERAESLDICYTFSTVSDSISCCFDSEQLQKVFFNLLSNAFKFTKNGGTVDFSLSENEYEVIVRVIDNGAGIDQADITKIFERFYQSSAKSRDISSGIGLALCKNIVTLHHGEITVESKPDYGSIFIVRLKKGTDHFKEDVQVEILCGENTSVDAHSLPDSGFMELLQETPSADAGNEGESGRYTLLIVEDNEELLSLLNSIFSPLYRILTATDGEAGLQIAIEEQPNIILSDVMMPKMDGKEMCLKLKSNIITSHIPVVLLTARTAPEHHIEGLLTGADDYVTKPFHAKILLAKVNTILRNRELLHGAFRKKPETHLELLAGNELDQKFLKKLEEIVEQHMEDPEFDVDQLVQLAGMGRSSFFEKLKALTGMTPANFVLIYRLKKAAALLISQPKLQMNDIASLLGFSSGRYFSRCFKHHFNVTPQQYREDNK